VPPNASTSTGTTLVTLDTTAQTLFVFEAEADATAKILATKPIEYLDVELTRELSDSVTGVKA
jgi:hypothetical protein